MKKNHVYSLAMWLAFVLVAILFAALRETLITPNTNTHFGHILSYFILIVSILLLTFLFLKSLKTNFSINELLWVGIMWILLTILFEFLFRHFVMGHPWSELLSYNNLFNGQLNFGYCTSLISLFVR